MRRKHKDEWLLLVNAAETLALLEFLEREALQRRVTNEDALYEMKNDAGYDRNLCRSLEAENDMLKYKIRDAIRVKKMEVVGREGKS